MNSSVVLCRGNMACCLPQRQLADPAQRMDSAVTSAHEHNGSAAKKQAVQYSTGCRRTQFAKGKVCRRCAGMPTGKCWAYVGQHGLLETHVALAARCVCMLPQNT